MNKNTKIKVRNRSTAMVGYSIPDLNNIRRTYSANETKEVSFEEIQKLSYKPGGVYMLQHYLVIENLEARDEILGDVELEYDYSEDDVRKLLLHGSLDELLDCLDFAPMGVIDMVKKIAVETELNDLRKRNAIQEKTGFNINSAILVNQETNEQEDEKTPTVRRVGSAEVEKSTDAAPVRRVVTKK